MEKRYNVKMKNIIPIYGIAEYMHKWPLLDSSEDREFIKRSAALGVYNIIFSIGAVFSIVKGLENLL